MIIILLENMYIKKIIQNEDAAAKSYHDELMFSFNMSNKLLALPYQRKNLFKQQAW